MPRGTRSVCSVLVVTWALSATAKGQAASIVHVDADATGPVHNGSSWCSAYLTMDEGIAAASVSGSIVRVANGNYAPDPIGLVDASDATFRLVDGVRYEGGYAGCGAASPNARDPEVYVTTLHGDLNGDDGPDFANYVENAYHVVTILFAGSNTVLDGFRITGGNADGPNAGPHQDSRDQGGGINVFHSNPQINDCVLEWNRSVNHGAMNDHGGATVTDCVFRNNWSGNIGAGLYVHLDVVTSVDGCLFEFNTTAGRGGGLYNKGTSALTVTNSRFDWNLAQRGGGMYNEAGASPTLTNCEFNFNNTLESESGGSGLFIAENGSPVIDQCAFSNNNTPPLEGKGGGIYAAAGSAPIISNCGFLNNGTSRYGAAVYIDGANVTMSNCTLTGNHGYYGSINVSTGGYLAISDSTIAFSNARHSGGVFFIQGTGLVTNVLFEQNFASGNAGASMVNFGPVTYRNCRFVGNVAAGDLVAGEGRGGAVQAGRATFVNCVFSGNSARFGGALALVTSSAYVDVANSTFSNNDAEFGDAISIEAYNTNWNQTLFMRNSIVWGSAAPFWDTPLPGENWSIGHSDIEGGWTGGSNMAVSPLFVDADGPDDVVGTGDDNLRLMPSSPCIEAGNNGFVEWPLDADNLTRIANSNVDMGAHEFQGAPPSACQPGTYSATGVAPCVPCPPGNYQPNDLATSCFPCQPGRVQQDWGTASCNPCAAGTYQPDSGAATCLDCPTGSQQPSAGATLCFDCLPGYHNPFPASAMCFPCPAGTHQPGSAAEDCLPCPPGTFQAQSGQAACDPCICDDLDVCTGDTCMPATGDCVFASDVCDDQDVCTRDHCDAGNCWYAAAMYGDVNDSAVVDVFDILCVLSGFGGDFSQCSLAQIDLAPCASGGDDGIDVFDILAVLDAFGGSDGCCL